ncbi:MAG: hypothetical protein Q9159_002913 [Coniocarpon cinnabarinum]
MSPTTTVTFNTLPAELRCRILEFVLEPGPVHSQCVLGFRNPAKESGPPTVYLTLPLRTLKALYLSNPAGTWLSFLQNRPPQLFGGVMRVNFRHWADSMYWEDLAHRNRLFARLWSILAVWRGDLIEFQSIAGGHMPFRACYEFTVASSPRISYTVRNGLPQEKTDAVVKRMELRVADAFSRFEEADGETPTKMVMDDDDAVEWSKLRDDRVFPFVQ